MTRCIGLTSGLICAVLTSSFVLAKQERRQERTSSRTEVRSEQRTRTTEVRRVSAVVGGTVRLSAGTSIGKIEDIVISDQGCIDYVIVSYHDHFVPIPWSVATVRYDDRVIEVDIAQDRFDEIPTFTRDEFHVLADVEFTKKVNKSFNVESTRRESRTREGSDRRRGDGDDNRRGDSRPKGKDGEVDRKGDRPTPKGKDDVKKEEIKKDNLKKDEPKDESRKDVDKKDRPKDSDKPQPKDKDKDSDKKDKDGPKG